MLQMLIPTADRISPTSSGMLAPSVCIQYYYWLFNMLELLSTNFMLNMFFLQCLHNVAAIQDNLPVHQSSSQCSSHRQNMLTIQLQVLELLSHSTFAGQACLQHPKQILGR